jgi:hypothetical protein
MKIPIYLAIPMAGYEDTLWGIPVAFINKEKANDFIIMKNNSTASGPTWKLERSTLEVEP